MIRERESREKMRKECEDEKKKKDEGWRKM